ncbi:MAG TPA: hypothetical protein VMU95_02795 [Trebonia sp.]|nr:hypothetical protein [Trebonia sp.]
MPTAQHEALHRLFAHDRRLFVRALRRVFGVDVQAPVDVTILNTDYTAEPGREDIVFAVLSAMTHSRSLQADVILDVLRTALADIDEESAARLSEFTEAGLGDTPAREIWRKLMMTGTFPYVSAVRSQGREEGREEGRSTGHAEAIIEVLDDRGIGLQDADRERILACSDAETLRTWLRRARRVATIRDLFTD